MENRVRIEPGERGCELWKAQDCPKCDSENTVWERSYHPYVWCSECEVKFAIELVPVV